MAYSIGQRINTREEDFIITKIEENGEEAILHVQGISELVKGKQFIFDTNIDREIKTLDPVNTELVADTHYGYRKTKLFVENQIRNSPVYSAQITIAQKAAFNLANYQLEPTLKAFKLPRPRLLIADGVGLGKTVEVGIFLAEMIKRGKGKRIMVLALKSILAQFQQEIWDRFAIPLVRLDSDGISKIKSELPATKNPFEYYDKTIVSIDTLKNNAKFQHYIEKTHWDIIVIDECHTVSNASSQRGSLAQLLSKKCESLILTSATPHNGKRENFANLINMIEPLAIQNEEKFTKSDIEPYYVRRFKNDIEDEIVRQNFQERAIRTIHADLTDKENAFLENQQKIKFDALDGLGKEDITNELFSASHKKSKKRDLLFAIGLFKAYMSSPEAALITIQHRVKKLRDLEAHETFEGTVEGNLEQLQVLEQQLMTIISEGKDAKYLAFKEELVRLHWKGKKNNIRIVVFAERIETLKSLKLKLQRDFKLDDKVIAEFNGSLTDMEQQRMIEDFGKEDSDIKILLTSDAGSQGVNLHYFCNHMFNYDIPWSLITLEQRNGRIDRYGQKKTPYIHYVVAKSDLKGLKDDLHIIDKLREKEEVVHNSLGDAASVYKLYDSNKEEDLVTKTIAIGDEALMDHPASNELEDDAFDALFEDTTPKMEMKEPIAASSSLFENDKAYYTALIEQLKTEKYLAQDGADFDGDLLEIKYTKELSRILYDLPEEAKPGKEGDLFQLSLNKDDVQEAISAARKKKGEWARLQPLYELHPVIRYLMTQLEASVDKDVALVSKIASLPEKMAYYLIHGSIANKLGQSIISDLFVMPMGMDGGMRGEPISFDKFNQQFNLSKELYTLDIPESDRTLLKEALPNAIRFAKSLHMDRKMQDLQHQMEKDLAVYQEKMNNWRKAKGEKLELDFEDSPEFGIVKRRKEDQKQYIETILNKSSHYYEDLTRLNGDPYLKVLAVFYNN